MNHAMDSIGHTGLRFFGTMTASMSHEIKNVLAIINENAGLIKDLTLMAEQGRPLNLDKIKSLADRFEKQVTRADEIVKSLNQFSHSVDDAIKQVDVGEALVLTLSLARRLIAMKNVTIDFKTSETAVTVNTNPFFLNNLMWFCLEYALDHPGEEKIVSIEYQGNESNVTVLFKGLDNLSHSSVDHSLFSPQGESVIQYLGATLDLKTKSNSFVVNLTHFIESP